MLPSFDNSRYASLSPREREVLSLMLNFPDENKKELAARLGMATKTLYSHSLAIYRKLGVHSRSGLQGYNPLLTDEGIRGMWIYKQSTGELFFPDGTLLAKGYAGAAEGLNNPAMQEQHNIGPLPRGLYTLGEAATVPGKGPVVMKLIPDPTNEMFGRDGFLVHGDNATPAPNDASHGCIILGRVARLTLAYSRERRLKVVA